MAAASPMDKKATRSIETGEDRAKLLSQFVHRAKPVDDGAVLSSIMSYRYWLPSYACMYCSTQYM